MTHQPKDNDGVDRRGFLECMACAGTALIWTLEAGRPTSRAMGAASATESFSFVQISDSHIGFDKAANNDVVGTLRQAIEKINALPQPPDFILHETFIVSKAEYLPLPAHSSPTSPWSSSPQSRCGLAALGERTKYSPAFAKVKVRRIH